MKGSLLVTDLGQSFSIFDLRKIVGYRISTTTEKISTQTGIEEFF